MSGEDDEYRPVSHSRMTLTELMIPAYANFSGKIHGGVLLSLMDKVAYACAAKHSGKYCVTVSVDGVDFHQPVEVGEMLSLMASVNYVGKTSLIVGIKVIAENLELATAKHTNTSYFTLVAKDRAGNPTRVPGLLLETEEDARRFLEAMERKALMSRYKSELSDAQSAHSGVADLRALEGQRVRFVEALGRG